MPRTIAKFEDCPEPKEAASTGVIISAFAVEVIVGESVPKSRVLLVSVKSTMPATVVTLIFHAIIFVAVKLPIALNVIVPIALASVTVWLSEQVKVALAENGVLSNTTIKNSK
jgi:hypothetical protein